MKRWLVALALIAPMPTLAATHEVVLSLQKLDCGECGGRAAESLAKMKGVKSTDFDLASGELRIVADESVSPESLAEAAKSDEYDVVVGAGKGEYKPFPELPPEVDHQISSPRGEDVPSLASLAVKDKVTVVDFFAFWCEPCRDQHEHLGKKLGSTGALRELNVIDWKSPLAAHYLKKIPGLPYSVVFDRHGKKAGEIVGYKPEKLDALIDKAGK